MEPSSDSIKTMLASKRLLESLSAAVRVGPEYYYSALPLCVVDAVYSIGVNYKSAFETTKRVALKLRISPFREYGSKPPLQGEIGISGFLEVLHQFEPETLASEFFENKQRTSATNGIRKAEAVAMFCRALSHSGIDDFGDATEQRLSEAWTKVSRIPGQNSGISFSYFRMLIGDDDGVKPDRMIQRFVEAVLARPVSEKDAAATVKSVASTLKMKPRTLDYAIWIYQRGADKNKDDFRTGGKFTSNVDADTMHRLGAMIEAGKISTTK